MSEPELWTRCPDDYKGPRGVIFKDFSITKPCWDAEVRRVPFDEAKKRMARWLRRNDADPWLVAQVDALLRAALGERTE